MVALDELTTGKVADLDKRLQAQSRSIDALNTTVAQTDDLLERVVDSIQSLPHAAEEAEPVAVAAGSPPATEVNDETDLGQIRQSRL